MNPIISRHDETALPMIAPLWEALNAIHADLSPHFGDSFRRRSFRDRHDDLVAVAAKGKMAVFIASDDGKPAGYCVASVSLRGDVCPSAEIESICLLPDYRAAGLGKMLMEHALRWIDSFAPEKVRVAVVTGHEDVFGFYERFGFYPRTTILERI